MSVEPIRVVDGRVMLLDQTLLPGEERWFECIGPGDVEVAIRTMRVRGAPLIGVTAAYGVALAARSLAGGSGEFLDGIGRVAARLAATRPTAVNLFWAIDRMKREASAVAQLPKQERAARLFAEAEAIREEDVRMCRDIGMHGAALLADGETVMTHCNAGALATAGYGSALGVFRAAVEQGKRVKVLARETRPLLQGARLTAWELSRDGVDVTVIPDGAAAWLMRTGRVDRVIVGADRIASNGDTANKIGTYDLAIIAREHGVPFHVAAPYSTVDFSLADGSDIPIEERGMEEVTRLGSHLLAPEGVAARNPAFDVTPARYITSIVTQAGIALPPYADSLSLLCRGR
ncbi:MAG: S-methyl-5-thioribose-1-phosphate isomerase [Deltaproteobacteria bacterium]|nr:S-methyl-5-thioribose-1-phosphate isomerase [Deltaproteobacteria bacterium]